MPSNRSASTVMLPSASVRTGLRAPCRQEIKRPLVSSMLPFALSLFRNTERSRPSRHCINLLLEISENTSVFRSCNQTGPSVNFMPPASFVTRPPGAINDCRSSAQTRFVVSRTSTTLRKNQFVMERPGAASVGSFLRLTYRIQDYQPVNDGEFIVCPETSILWWRQRSILLQHVW